MTLMDGKKIAEQRFLQLKMKIKEENLSPSLAVVCLNRTHVSETYMAVKQKLLEKVGITVSIYYLEENMVLEEIKKKISDLKEDGIIVQLPISRRPEEVQEILNCIPQKKDVDFLSETSCGKFYSGTTDFLPPVVGAINILLQEYEVECRGRSVVIIGAGRLVGKPLSLFFMKKQATVSILNSDTNNLSYFTKNADIIVSGTGVPSLLKGEIVKKGVVVIDAGTSGSKGELKGDVDQNSVMKKASFLTPVPGGVGPLTIYVLACNLLDYEY